MQHKLTKYVHFNNNKSRLRSSMIKAESHPIIKKIIMTMDQDTAIILPEYVSAYLELPEQLGLPKPELSRLTGVDLNALSDRSTPFSLNEILSMIKVIMDALNMPYAGLAVGQQMRLTCHGMAGVSAMAQRTYAECLQAAASLCEKAFPPFSMEYFETKNTVGLRIIEVLSLHPFSHFFAESITVNFKNILQFLLGKEYQPEYVGFPYPPPAYENIYERYFNCKIKFNTDHTEFVVSKKLAQKELLLANQGIARMAEEDFLKSIPPINLNYLPKKLRLVLIQSVGAFPSLECAARKLGMSGRTLRRQLNSMGTNFQNELDLLRREFAISYLTKSDKCITEIALMLGFCDSSAFSKAFKKWTGESPREFKKQYGQQYKAQYDAIIPSELKFLESF
ncbi:MAG: AraC family transcriptional regulator [Ketobacter sp.]|nr:MAG: AraC family transcriptional regulator [Ketobacter sp.]